MSDFYEKEIAYLPDGHFYAIQIREYGGSHTNWLNLNKESIPVVIEFLQQLLKKKDEEDKND